MNPKFSSALHWIAGQENNMLQLVEAWSAINSGSGNLPGLEKMLDSVRTACLPTGGRVQTVELPPRKIIDTQGNWQELPSGKALLISKHTDCRLQVCLGGHMDTVFSPAHPFQHTERIGPDKLRGPGVLDMKGGLVIMITALEALEKSPFSGKIGWQAFITPDEEVGSISSINVIKECAKNKAAGLIFEPAHPDGSLASSRKGTIDMAIVVHGKAAHSGRDFYEGKSAIVALAKLIAEADQFNDKEKGITLNFGKITGGGTANIIPALAIAEVNIRGNQVKDLEHVKASLENCRQQIENERGVRIAFHELEAYPPKPFEEKDRLLFASLQECAKELDVPLSWRPSGGVCDGNFLAACGLPVIDSLGAVGAHMHTADEFIYIHSLKERACLTALFLMKLADGEIVRRG